MSGLTDTSFNAVKMLLVGKSGTGKTGALASLVAAGYKLRIIDTDSGARILSSLLLDRRYPYRAFCEKRGIDVTSPEVVSVKTISQEMSLRSVSKTIGNRTTNETIQGPKNGNAYLNVLRQLENWKEGDGTYGHLETWDDSVVAVFDTFSTLAKIAYYHVQALNGRLGARDEGYDYQRDIGGAQSLLSRLLEWLASPSVKCNVIVSTHVTWVDDSQGYVQSPEQRVRNQQTTYPDGYPAAIGRALSPVMGKHFNDSFNTWKQGSGVGTKRFISTVPNEGVLCKNSSYLAANYDITTGLAEIFAAMRRAEPDKELLAICGKPVAIPSKPSAVTATATGAAA